MSSLFRRVARLLLAWPSTSLTSRWRIFRFLRSWRRGFLDSALVALSPYPPAWLLPRVGPRLLADCTLAASRAGVSPYLLWGTLLGYRRQGALIDGDNDLDFAVGPEALDRLEALEDAFSALGLRLERRTPFVFQIFYRSLPIFHADFWIMYPLGTDLVTSVGGPGGKGHYLFRLPATSLRRLREAELLGCPVLIPEECDLVLALCYGDWTVPDPFFHYGKMPCAELLERLPAIPGI